MTSWRVGDNITSGETGGAPLRFGGLRYGRNFAVQPGSITFPCRPSRSGGNSRGPRCLRQQRPFESTRDQRRTFRAAGPPGRHRFRRSSPHRSRRARTRDAHHAVLLRDAAAPWPACTIFAMRSALAATENPNRNRRFASKDFRRGWIKTCGSPTLARLVCRGSARFRKRRAPRNIYCRAGSYPDRAVESPFVTAWFNTVPERLSCPAERPSRSHHHPFRSPP